MKKMVGVRWMLGAALFFVMTAAVSRAEVAGRALLTDARSRVVPGNLVLCTMSVGEKKFETIVTGQVVDAHFSPDGKQIVYAMDGMIKTMDLKTRASKDVVQCTSNFTYFTWCTDNRIYWSEGGGIYSVDLESKEKKMVSKGRDDRATLSLDGKKAAWVKPPVCAVIGGKTYSYMGGCGGAVSPSGKYLTSNLTTSHILMGIFSFDDNGPSEKPIAMVVALKDHAINGFSFGRSDDWVCYTVEGPASASPTAYIAYWRTDDHFEIAPKLVIKDFYDDGAYLPEDATLEKITVCSDSPVNTPLTNEFVNAGDTRPIRVVGHFRSKGGIFTPQLRDGITWKTDAAKLALTATGCKGLAEAARVTATAEYKGKTASFDVTVLPALTGDGFKAEYFSDGAFTKSALTRVEQFIDYRWDGNSSPDKAIKGAAPWSVCWSGSIDIQTDGDYTFFMHVGEGNDRTFKREGLDPLPCCTVLIDGVPVVFKGGGYPWGKPRAGVPVKLAKGMHEIKVTTIDCSVHPVVSRLTWSGPGIKASLLGGRYVHSNTGKGDQK